MNAIYPWQQTDWARLQELRRHPPHALLFKGGRGIGKFDLAQHYAHSLLCEQPDADGFACGSCSSCHWLEQGSHPDFRLLQPGVLSAEAEDAESGRKPGRQITVEQVRALADFFGMSAHQGGRRVVIIHPAEAMNVNAANALLKNLEEPPEGVLFMLVTHKPQQLLPTILSRCLAVTLSAPDAASATDWLAGQGVADPAPALAAAGYAPLEAVRLDEQLDSEARAKLLRAVRQPALLDVFALADALQKTEQVQVVQWLQQWCYDLSAMKQAGRVRYHPGEAATIRRLVEPVDPLNLARLQRHLQGARREAQHTLNARLFLEALLLSYRQLLLE